MIRTRSLAKQFELHQHINGNLADHGDDFCDRGSVKVVCIRITITLSGNTSKDRAIGVSPGVFYVEILKNIIQSEEIIGSRGVHGRRVQGILMKA